MAANPEQRRQPVCKNVRCKESFYSNEPFKEDMFHSGVYWCHRTQSGIGPDGRAVDAEECSPTRECFEP